jgi:large subunit ribosomal protein L4
MTAKTVKVDLPAEIFDAKTNIPLMHQVVVAQQAAARQGTHATKTRGDVRGGGRKPYKQKGTGRARQGSTRAPQFAGGGVVHGPHPRDYDQRTPKKMKAAALRGALSDRARSGRIHVVESLIGEQKKPSTKDAVAALNGLTEHRRQLVVLERDDALTWLSLRNVASVHLLAVDQLNTYDVLLCDDVVFTKGAYDAFVNGTASATARKAVIVEPAGNDAANDAVVETAETEDAPVEADVATEEFAGSAAPLENGDAPEGYEIKGNKDSMKYHAPGGQWYDATVAEVWFQTAADAEAAGFVEAGSQESVEQTHADEEDTK